MALAAGILLFSACQKGSIYHRSVVIPAKGWDMNVPLVFADTLPEHTPTVLKRELSLRNNNAFPYQNIWLYIQTQTSFGIKVDTINWQLATSDGNWLGKGWGSLYIHTYELPDLVLPTGDTLPWFKVELVHGLRDSLLTGVSDLGLRLYTE